MPYPPMEAASVDEIPSGAQWQYEPKWDGFRCLAFRDGDEVALQSKSGQPLARYFPEVVEQLRGLKAARFVIDGEIVIEREEGLSFDDLLQRIHPAASRVKKLAAETPGTLLAFDLLVDADGSLLTDRPLSERRRALEKFAGKFLDEGSGIRLSPAARDRKTVDNWFRRVGGAMDGVIAKRLDLPYQSGLRTGARKVKKLRTADCVVGGFRYASGSVKAVGSLLLGLYDEEGLLDHVGFTSGISAGERVALLQKLLPLVKPPGFTGQAPGGPSRWSTERSVQWEPLEPKLVVEVSFDHISGGRFRHGTRLLRWRPDKAPRQCTIRQMDVGAKASLLDLSADRA
ncbi:MAG: ATP-dependent DNA ligase [Candidatus Eremiobacteraeota bacterium]|nr:ATP-dependent DNA ligase [Candidatus Eremiobacteraeota bacterium]MBC5826975.1 ATP-dependent DNA ligase [Candidatus Eremiobacteraeota bacterium]